MAATIEAIKIIYYPVPKCAGTSVRTCLFEIENGYPWQDRIIKGRKRSLHKILGVPAPFRPMPLPAPTWERIAIIRDPVERFLSMFRNRVLHYGDAGSPMRGQRYLGANLPRMPDLETFVANLAEYRKFSQSGIIAIRRHIFSGMTLAIINAFSASIASTS